MCRVGWATVWARTPSHSPTQAISAPTNQKPPGVRKAPPTGTSVGKESADAVARLAGHTTSLTKVSGMSQFHSMATRGRR
jgi:hypothetical protein